MSNDKSELPELINQKGAPKVQVPAMMRRRIILLYGSLSLMTIMGIMTIALVDSLGINKALYTWILFWVSMVLFAGLSVDLVRRSSQLKKKVEEAEGLLCWRCGYRLDSIAAQGQCPECGSEYDHANLKRLWQECGYIDRDKD